MGRLLEWQGAGAHTRPAQRRRFVASGVVVCPLISGLFFGFIAALLVLRSGDPGRAFEVGGLVGGAMFASNAIALCIVQGAARDLAVPRVPSGAQPRTRVRAS